MFEPLLTLFHDEHFMDLSIYQYGYEKCKPLHSFGPYVRNHYLFHFVLSGKGILITNDANGNVINHYIEKGHGFLIEPGHVNTYSADQDDPWEYVWIEFGGLRARECMQMTGLSNENPVYTPDTPEGAKEIIEEFFHIAKQTEASSLELMGHMYLLMDQISKHSTARTQIQGGKLSEFYVREAMNFIEQNYARDIKIEDIEKEPNKTMFYEFDEYMEEFGADIYADLELKSLGQFIEVNGTAQGKERGYISLGEAVLTGEKISSAKKSKYTLYRISRCKLRFFIVFAIFQTS